MHNLTFRTNQRPNLQSKYTSFDSIVSFFSVGRPQHTLERELSSMTRAIPLLQYMKSFIRPWPFHQLSAYLTQSIKILLNSDFEYTYNKLKFTQFQLGGSSTTFVKEFSHLLCLWCNPSLHLRHSSLNLLLVVMSENICKILLESLKFSK